MIIMTDDYNDYDDYKDYDDCNDYDDYDYYNDYNEYDDAFLTAGDLELLLLLVLRFVTQFPTEGLVSQGSSSGEIQSTRFIQ